MEIELLKVLSGSGGPLMVCVALVILFLRHLKDMHAEHGEARKAFQEQIQKLTSDVLEVSRETAVAVKGLEVAVRDLQEKIK